MSVFDDIERAVNFSREYENNPKKILMPKAVYDKLDPKLIAEKEREFNCEIVPVEHKVSKPEREVRNLCFKPQDAMRLYKRGHKHKR